MLKKLTPRQFAKQHFEIHDDGTPYEFRTVGDTWEISGGGLGEGVHHRIRRAVVVQMPFDAALEFDCAPLENHEVAQRNTPIAALIYDGRHVSVAHPRRLSVGMWVVDLPHGATAFEVSPRPLCPCGKPTHARGLCAACYMSARKAAAPMAERKVQRTGCKWPSCTGAHVAKGFCSRHYRKGTGRPRSPAKSEKRGSAISKNRRQSRL